MNKPVKCRCGGEAYHASAGCWNPEEEEWMPNFWHKVICKNCGTQTKAFYTKTEAVQAWNRAMGERTVKVRDIVHTHGYPDEGLCGNCNEDVNGLYDYCPNCGVKLDWSENG